MKNYTPNDASEKKYGLKTGLSVKRQPRFLLADIAETLSKKRM